MSAEFVV